LKIVLLFVELEDPKTEHELINERTNERTHERTRERGREGEGDVGSK
jgi:hypothetical protein